MRFTIFTSGKQQVASETIYPNKIEVVDKQTAISAFTFDHVCAEFTNNQRGNANFISSDVICLDCDNDHSEDPDEWMDETDYEEMFKDVNYVLVPSRNHMKVKDGKSARPRHHIYFPIAKVTDATKYREIKEEIVKDYSFFDSNALDAARFFFGHNLTGVVWHDGAVNIDFIYTPNIKATVAQGGRNTHMSQFAAKILKRLGDCDEAREGFDEEAEKCVPPLDDDELDRIWKSALKFYGNISNNPNYIPPAQYNPDGLKPGDYSDIGQATVMLGELGEELKFTTATDLLVYDGVSWLESKQKAIGLTESFLNIQLAEAKTVLKKAHDALVAMGIAEGIIAECGVELKKACGGTKAYRDYKDALEYLKFVLKRRDMKYVVSALQAIKPMVEIEPSDLDKDAYLLNCTDGTYNLRDGMNGFQEHKNTDYITKVTSCAPGDDGMDMWLETLDTIFQGNAELINYVNIVVGMAAIGEVNLEAMIIAYGGGSNGKSTFWNAIAAVLGSYSGKISADTLTVNCNRNTKPELAEAKGKRLLIASELKEGMRLDTSMVKQLCSTDEVFAEKKYKDPFSFIPSHTLVLYTNHLPRVGGTDDGIWRRLIVIPFLAKIKGKNKNYTNVLIKKASPYILKWVIEGAQKAIKCNFYPKTPQCVLDAISEYRQENDWMCHFLEDCCETGQGYEEKSGDLYDAYRDYSIRTNGFTRSPQEFTRELENRGFVKKRKTEGRFFAGLRLLSEFA